MTDTPARKKLGLKPRPESDTAAPATVTRSGPRARMAQERQRAARGQAPTPTTDASGPPKRSSPPAPPSPRPPARSDSSAPPRPRRADDRDASTPPRPRRTDDRDASTPPRPRRADDRNAPTRREAARPTEVRRDDARRGDDARRAPRPAPDTAGDTRPPRRADPRPGPRPDPRPDRRPARAWDDDDLPPSQRPREDRRARPERAERPADAKAPRRPASRSPRDARPGATRAAAPLAAGLFRWFAPCPRGLESVLAQELAHCEAQQVHIVPGGCQFIGPLRVGYLVNLHSRIASRVLREVKQASYHNEHDVFDAALAIDWSTLFAVERTIKVETVGIHPQVPSLEFVTLRIKDAICDRMRDATGRRPDIDTRTPDIRVHAFLTADIVTFYLDTSGEALFKRGWRHDKVEAPLRENLAAGLLALLGWQPGTPLLDPFCGSGTIAIEAGWMAQHRPPGLTRAFAFERLADFDAALWHAICADARAQQRPDAARDLYASDISIVAVPIARANAAHAGVPIELRQIDAQHLQPPGERPGLIVCNPPYGERISVRGKRAESEDDAEFFANFASTLKQRFAGWHVAILSSDPALTTKLHLKPHKTWALFNGALPCKLYLFDMVSGTHRGR